MSIGGEECARTDQDDRVPFVVMGLERGEVEPFLISANPLDTALDETLLRVPWVRRYREAEAGALAASEVSSRKSADAEVWRQKSFLNLGCRKQLWEERRVLAISRNPGHRAGDSHGNESAKKRRALNQVFEPQELF